MNSFILFLVFVITNFLLAITINRLVLTEDVYYYTLIDTLSEERIQEFVKSQRDFEWIGYAFGPVIFGLKVFLVSACVYTGFFFRNIDVKFSDLFLIALKSEFVFLIIPLARLIWFTLFQQPYTLEGFSDFPPYTILSLFDGEVTERWLRYPLGFVNLVQLAYIFLMAQNISNEFDMTYGKSATLVLQTYGTGLFIWVLFTVFLLVTMS